MAVQHGYVPEIGHELDWNDTISWEADSQVVIDRNWIEGCEIEEPKEWNPKKELITYLETLFDASENVGYVTHSFEKDGRHMPSKGVWNKTAGQLIQELNRYDEIEFAIDPARCPDTAAEFSEYEYARDPRTGEVLPGYPDVNNHHIDAVRYALEGVWRRRGN